MPLLLRIGEIFNINLSVSLERFRVPDTCAGRPGLEVVLLVESPHEQEVEAPEIDDRYPLAGTAERSAGRHVRDKLTEWAQDLELPVQPIGQLVHQEFDAVQRLGIMNVSQLPFQASPYAAVDGDVCENEHWDDYIKCMEHIKGNPYVRKYRWDKMNDLRVAITEDLKARLDNLVQCNPNVLLVPCGDVAAAFYLRAAIARLPHPSLKRGGWRTLNAEERRHKETIIERLWPP